VKRIASYLLAASVLVSAPSVGADAPKQTVENAHLFIETVVRQHGLKVEVETSPGAFNQGPWKGIYRREREVSGVYVIAPFPADSVTGDKCRTEFRWPYDPFEPLMDYQYGDVRNSSSRTGVAGSYEGVYKQTSLTIDWSRVPGLSHNETHRQIHIIGAGRITAPTVELATRLHYAMEFLRNACDPTAATGF
jgi:hypothetical protein